jgi:ubiquitin C-terminal hydrolase
MDMTIDEFQRLADEKARQAIKIADLERLLAERTVENEQLKCRLKTVEDEFSAARLEIAMLKHYIILSVEKIKTFVMRLKSLDRFAFLKTFLEDVLPKEHYSEQLLLVNEVMTYQEEPKQVPPVQNNHYVNMTGNGASYTENNATGPQTPEN